MTKTIQASKMAAANAYKAAKIAAICAVVITSIVGSYVIANGELRNQTIDFAQGERPNE